jgi:hypothetical protein
MERQITSLSERSGIPMCRVASRLKGRASEGEVSADGLYRCERAILQRARRGLCVELRALLEALADDHRVASARPTV